MKSVCYKKGEVRKKKKKKGTKGRQEGNVHYLELELDTKKGLGLSNKAEIFQYKMTWSKIENTESSDFNK